MQKKVINFIVVELITNREADPYRQIFYEINKTADGMCTKQQFIEAFWKLGYTEMSEDELGNLLAYIDDDRNGFVTFEEFLTASIHPEDVLNPEKLSTAFKVFDRDKSGSISIAEFKEAVDKDKQIPDS